MKTTFLKELGLEKVNPGTWTGTRTVGKSAEYVESFSPVDGKLIGKVSVTNEADYIKVIQKAENAFKSWRTVPAPKRGEIIRQYGNVLRENKDALGRLVSYEMGKSLQEGWGEVRTMAPSGNSGDYQCI